MTSRLDALQANLLVNGGFPLFQRSGTSSAVNLSTSSVYVAPDRWKQWYTGTVTGNVTSERSTERPNRLSKYSNKVDFQRNASTLVLSWEQRLEAIDVERLLDLSSVSLGIQIKCPIASSQARLTLLYPTAEDNHTAQTQFYQDTQDLSGTDWDPIVWENIPVNLGMENGLAVRVEILIPTGTDGSVESLYLTQIMMTSGRYTRPFRQYGGDLKAEIAKSCRYYEKSYNIDTAVGTATSIGQEQYVGEGNTPNRRTSHSFAVRKRVAPTMGAYNVVVDGGGSYSFHDTGEGRFSFQNGNNGRFHSFQWDADAEL